MIKKIMLVTALAVFFCGKISAIETIECSWQDDPPCLTILVGNSNKLNDQISQHTKYPKQKCKSII